VQADLPQGAKSLIRMKPASQSPTAATK